MISLAQLKEMIGQSKTPYKKAATALWNAAQRHKGDDKSSLLYHHKMLSSSDPKDHELSANHAGHHDTYMRDIVSDAVHHNSSKRNSAKWHNYNGIKRLK